ncbi:radical SAM protein [Patescibacteria group bacterium]|nr:radical SAM protein [Patescibacteria group bacterium]
MKERSKGLSLAIGKSCFLRCPGCYNHFSLGPLVSKEAIRDFAKTVKRDVGLETITVCGGDPLSRPDILEILQSLKEENLKVQVDTTGIPLMEDARLIFYGTGAVKKIPLDLLAKSVDLLGLPIDGSTDEITKMFRQGRSNYTNNVISLAKRCAEYDIKVCINTVVHKGNYRDLKNIADLLVGLPSVIRWQLFQFSPTGPIAYHNRDKYFINTNIFNQAIFGLQEYLSFRDHNISVEPKSNQDRNDSYILVDSGGDVWSPQNILLDGDNFNNEDNSRRIVFGNINEKSRLRQIIYSAYNY